jgi:hypothetical protein
VGVRSLLIAGLPVIINVSVADQFSDYATTLQCVVLASDGKIATLAWGGATAIEFMSGHGTSSTGSIVFDDAGDAGTVLANESAFASAASTDKSVNYVSPIIGVHGAQLQIADRVDGSCYVEMRPDSASTWTWYGPSKGPAVLALFLGLHQVGRPTKGGQFSFNYPLATVTIQAQAGGVTVDGPTPALAKAASDATRCPTIDTLERAGLEGPPGL